jgi:coenzyme F420-dependent glucose-6-phosphate dehydrogenase
MNGSVVGKDAIMERMCISGDIDEHIRYAQHFIDMGFTHLYYHTAGPDQRDFIVGYGRDVLPRIRENQRQTIKI